MGSMTRQVNPTWAALGLAAAFAGVLATGCASGDAPTAEEARERQVFIDAYVDLRLAALEAADFRVAPERRDVILARHGTDHESLLRFADVHGPDLEYMNDVWADIERLLQERMPSEATSAAGLTRPPGA